MDDFFFLFYLDPLLVKAARGDPVSRPPAWMMRQAGRYMAVYRKLAEKYPSFRERSETTDLIVEISLQPWKAFRPDGVIIFSDILTPLPAFGVDFDIEDIRGPVIHSPIRSEEDLKTLHPIDFDKLKFVGESLKILRQEVKFILPPHSCHDHPANHVFPLLILFYSGWWSCSCFGFCGSSLDNSNIYCGRGYNTHIYNH